MILPFAKKRGFSSDAAHVCTPKGLLGFLSHVQAQILTRIHHKSLVSMIGYCKEGQYMALVYEYMPEGTLKQHIDGNFSLHSSPQHLK